MTLAEHIHFFDIDTEALELYVALVGAVGIVIAAYVNTRRTRKHVERIDRNIQPSNGDTLAETVEGNALVLRTLVAGQHQIGGRIDTLRNDLNDQRIDVQEMDRINQEAHAAILLEVRKRVDPETAIIAAQTQELITEVKKRADPKVGPAHVHKRMGDKESK